VLHDGQKKGGIKGTLVPDWGENSSNLILRKKKKKRFKRRLKKKKGS